MVLLVFLKWACHLLKFFLLQDKVGIKLPYLAVTDSIFAGDTFAHVTLHSLQ